MINVKYLMFNIVFCGANQQYGKDTKTKRPHMLACINTECFVLLAFKFIVFN